MMLGMLGLAVGLAGMAVGGPLAAAHGGDHHGNGPQLGQQPYLQGPVLPENFPDPCIAWADGAWWSFATHTENSRVNIKIARSPDYHHWEIVRNSDGTAKDALPNAPQWAFVDRPNLWAPDVNQLDDGSWIMYFSVAAKSDPSKHCIGAAKAAHVSGPYTAVGEQPWECDLRAGGAVDASGFKDSGGQRYVLYKIDSNSLGGGPCSPNPSAPLTRTPIQVQKVAADGATREGDAVTILENSGATDEGVIGAPSVAQYGSKFVLFFSSGCFSGANYTVSYAWAPTIQGPFERYEHPLVKTGDYDLFAPGGADVYTDASHIVLHASKGHTTDVRQLYVGEIVYRNKKVVFQ